MTRRPHDALFKAAFEQPEHAGGLFRSILPVDVSEAIAWDTLTPLPGSFVDPELADSHSDILFSVMLGDERVLLYLIIPAIVSHTPDGWTAPVRFEDLFVPHPSSLPSLVHLIPHFSLLLEDLTHVSDADLNRSGWRPACWPESA